MYLMDHETPSYRTFGYFINDILEGSIKDIFNDINKAIFEKEGLTLSRQNSEKKKKKKSLFLGILDSFSSVVMLVM